MHKVYLIIGFLVTCLGTIQAQTKEEVLGLINSVTIPKGDFYYEIPFDYSLGSIIINVQVGGETYTFNFDTGGYTMITDALQQKNNFTVVAAQTVGSSNGLKNELNVIKADSLLIGGLAFKNLAMHQFSLKGSPILSCMLNGGFIGANIIKKCVWQIDYPRRIITVTNNKDKLKGLKKAVKVPVTFNAHLQPYIKANINGQETWVMFDTGSNSEFWLGKDEVVKHKNSKEVIIEGGGIEAIHGKVESTLTVMNVDYKIGPLKFRDKPAYYEMAANLTLLGSPIIENYVVTLNFPESEIYFSPIEGKPLTNGWENFGFTLAYRDGKHKILTLFKGFAAEKAGLAIGDVVVALNGSPIACDNLCDCGKLFTALYTTATELTLTVQKPEGLKEIKLTKEKIF